jgi:hypothetical protein
MKSYLEHTQAARSAHAARASRPGHAWPAPSVTFRVYLFRTAAKPFSACVFDARLTVSNLPAVIARGVPPMNPTTP